MSSPVVWLIGLFTIRNQTRKRVQFNNAILKTMDSITDSFLLFDSDFRCISVNSSARVNFPFLAGIDKGTSITEQKHWPRELSAEVLSSEDGIADFTLNSKSYHADVYTIPGAGRSKKKHFTRSVLIRDVTNESALLAELQNAAYTDSLTGLYNRRHFYELSTIMIEQSKRQNRLWSVLMADLDDFKLINDTFGHDAGDAVLVNVAKVLKAAVRPYDIVARYGGEEFIFLITEADEKNVRLLADRIRRSVESSTVTVSGESHSVTISIGIAGGDSTIPLPEAVTCADIALYNAKRAGKNQISYTNLKSQI